MESLLQIDNISQRIIIILRFDEIMHQIKTIIWRREQFIIYNDI